MKRYAFLLAAGLVLAGCGDSRLDAAHTAVKGQLKDPGSAQFQNDRVLDSGRVCGEVNAKNAMGGYTGFKPYTYAEKQPPLIGQEDWQAETVADYCKDQK